MAHQVLALKWRPRTFHEVVGQPHVVKALSNGLDQNRLHHAFLFTGTRGVGKTTLARIFAKSLNCEEGVSSTPCGQCSICQEVDSGRFVDLIEIDAASRTKVEDTREILDNVQYAPTRGRYKIYLIDEVHMLSNSSFNALLKTLEEPPSHVKFLLATTDPQKLPVTVLSRCLRLQLKRINVAEIKGQLQYILNEEKIPYDDKATSLIALSGEGSMRDSLSILDQAIAYTGSNITYELIKEMLGIIDNNYIVMILDALATQDTENILLVTKKLSEFGLNYKVLLESLITAFHELTLLQINESYTDFDFDEKERYLELKNQFSAEDLQLYYQVALHGRRDLSLHPNTELGFEMTLLRMVLFSPDADLPPKKKVIERKEEIPSTITVDIEKIADLEKAETVFELNPNVNLEQKKDLKTDTPSQTDSTFDLAIIEPQIESEIIQDVEILYPELNNQIEHDSHLPLATREGLLTLESVETSLDSVVIETMNLETKDFKELVVESSGLARELKTNQDWLNLVETLPLESIVRGVAHSLVFKYYSENNLILVRSMNDRSFNISDAESEISRVVSEFLGEQVLCQIEYINTELDDENLQQRNERLDLEKWEESKSRLLQDPVVLHLQKSCAAELLEKTIKVS